MKKIDLQNLQKIAAMCDQASDEIHAKNDEEDMILSLLDRVVLAVDSFTEKIEAGDATLED